MKKSPIYVVQQNLFEVEPIDTKPTQKEKSDDSYVFDLVDAISSPVLTFSQLWADMIPKRLFGILPLARMIALKQGEQLATYVECVIYIYTCTLEAPMDSEWVDIYTHVTCKTLQDWFNEDRWKEVGAPPVLSERLHSKLDGLRCHIYNKRREILKSQQKAEEATKHNMPKEEKSSEIETTQQQSLFTP